MWYRRSELVVLVVAVAALVVPTYARLGAGLWNQEAYEHGPIIAALFWWLVWRCRQPLADVEAKPNRVLGGLVFVAGLLLYFVGRSQALPLFEVAAEIPIFAGIALCMLGAPGLRVIWFPLLFLVFLVPLPGFLIVGITAELKQYVSAVAENVLYHAGYPIARDGVVITIGQYQMLVADACSGLNSMYSLTAMGLLYLYLVNRKGWWHNLALIAAILPIAFVANVIRVLVLILLTYHFGDAAGQGFLHSASGVLLFVIALLLLMGLDAVSVRLSPGPRTRTRSESS